MILVMMASAWADPDVLRLPVGRLGLSVGTAGVSGAYWFDDRGLAVAANWANVGVYGAVRTPVSERWHAGLAGGFVFPFAAPGVAVETAASLGVGWHGHLFDGGLDLVVPAAVSITEGTARVGVRLDPRFGVHFGDWSMFVVAGAGLVTATDSAWALDTRAGVGVGWMIRPHDDIIPRQPPSSEKTP